MLPLSDDNRGRTSAPYVTWALIVINIVIYAFEFMMSERDLMRLFEQWAVIPQDLSDGRNLHTVITSAFLHGSWLHVLGNMLFLWIFGDNVEDVMGHLKYLVFYLLTAVGASALQVALDTHSAVPMVGASGAISGVLGAYIVLFPKGQVKTLIFLGIFVMMRMIPAWVVIGLWIGMQIISAFGSFGGVDPTGGGGVAYFAHVGGFIAGVVLVWLFRDKERVAQQNEARQQRQGVLGQWGVTSGGGSR